MQLLVRRTSLLAMPAGIIDAYVQAMQQRYLPALLQRARSISARIG